MKIDGTDSNWTLYIHLPDRQRQSICISMKIKDENPSPNHLFKVEIKADVSGHQLLTPANRHHVRTEGMFAAPKEIQPEVVSVNFRRLNNGDKYFLEEVPFMHNHDLTPYLYAGTFTILAHVWMKEIEVVDSFCNERKSDY